MLPTVIKSCPSADNDFEPLSEYQARTPETFFEGKPILYYHDNKVKAWVSNEQFKRLYFFSDAAEGDINSASPSPPESYALENNGGKHLREGIVEVFVASKYVGLLAIEPSSGTGIEIPYPAITLHAVKNFRHLEKPEDDAFKFLGVYMQLEFSDSNTDDDETFDPIELTLIPYKDASQDPSSTEGPTPDPLNRERANALFNQISACSNLNPDPRDEEEEEEAEADRIIFEGEHETLEGFTGVLRGDTSGGLPPPMPGSSGWITADNVQEYFDADGNWIGGDGAGGDLGEGAGRVRTRDDDGVNGADGHDDEEDKEIRRIKCDEKKPACVRCTSTGRRCDGYDGPVVHPNPTPRAKAVDALGPTVRILRSITADIVGTQAERWYFHRFRSAAAGGFALHTTNLGSFWNILVPQVAHHDEAVKHAAVALGSAFHMHDRRLEEGDAQRLEVFVITQYNKAIRSLQRHVESASPECTEITLLCCLMFTFLEAVRSRSDAALVHFAHGRRILDTLLPSASSYLCDPLSFGDAAREREQLRQRECRPIARHISEAEWRQLLAFFAELEFMSYMHSAGDRLGNLGGPPPLPSSSSSHRATTMAPAAGGSDPDPDSSTAAWWQYSPEAALAFDDEYEDEDEDYGTLDECHHEFFAWGSRVFARVIETLPHKGDAAF
ncbi:hypothetical protein DL762_005256 [Monosporascus cannonballus]|uniref:Zn(2)-C6 fungal-type domain-containing protein n=1 Tax=Monosporascus cannonballus TaxID=155416 RepID=A0ABY0HA08_9PEZI|nr:hypothetical protein DL762_005256 [Monosporascus cannonballus]